MITRATLTTNQPIKGSRHSVNNLVTDEKLQEMFHGQGKDCGGEVFS